MMIKVFEKKLMKKLLPILLCVISVSALTAVRSYAVTSKKVNSYDDGGITILRNIRIHKVPAQKSKKTGTRSKLHDALPSAYDSRKQAWWRDDKIRIKDQHSSQICWAFATMTAAEISYLKETGGVKTLSPTHFAYFFFNRENDPLGNTENDKNLTDAYNPEPWYNSGGNIYSSSQALANWMGAVTEEKAPFNTEFKAYDAKLAYDNYITGQNSIIVDATDKSAVKRAVSKYGAVVTSCVSGYNHKHGDGTYNQYYNGGADSNHAVVVIGWDDNYPKEKFAAKGGKYSIPKKDGAWIVQNSWGEEYKEYRISYEDTSFAYVGTDDDGNDVKSVNALDMQPAESYRYNYQYDGTAGLDNVSLGKDSRIANVFCVGDGDKILEAAGFTTFNDGDASYSVEVYTDLKDNANPESGKKVCNFDVETRNTGSYTFKLGDYGLKPVKLRKNSSYSIVITTKTQTYFGVEDNADYGSLKCEAQIEKNQSFIKINTGDEWTDMHDNADKMCARIKGFANDDPDPEPPGGEDAEEPGKDPQEEKDKNSPEPIMPTDSNGTDRDKVAAKPYNSVTASGTKTGSGTRPKEAVGTSIGKIKAKKKKCILIWKKRANGIDGYQIQYSKSKKFKSPKTRRTGRKNNRVALKRLKSNTKYYIRIRTYTKFNGRYSYSRWSGVRTVRIR